MDPVIVSSPLRDPTEFLANLRAYLVLRGVGLSTENMDQAALTASLSARHWDWEKVPMTAADRSLARLRRRGVLVVVRRPIRR